jgi:hypothetical protein
MVPALATVKGKRHNIHTAPTLQHTQQWQSALICAYCTSFHSTVKRLLCSRRAVAELVLTTQLYVSVCVHFDCTSFAQTRCLLPAEC